jgi:hypothetical protein
MGPNQTADEMVAVAVRLEDHADDDVAYLCELVLALDRWMKQGGCKPHRWQVIG